MTAPAAPSGWDVDEGGKGEGEADADADGWADGGVWGEPFTPSPAPHVPPVAVVAAPPCPAAAPEPAAASCSSTFAPLALEWFDEPVADAVSDLTTRAQRLLDEFLAEGDAEEVDAFRSACGGGGKGGGGKGGGGGGGGEAYERLSAKEKHLLRFQETIALAPSQCVRCAIEPRRQPLVDCVSVRASVCVTVSVSVKLCLFVSRVW